MSFATGTAAYARHVGRYTDALAELLVERVGVRKGDRALDVGCGPGAVVAAFSQRVGPENVAAAEPSAPFAALARERVPAADIRIASAESLPFPDREFDVVVSQLVVNFMSDALAGVGEMRRVSRGTVASCVWDYAGEMTMLRAFWDAALELDPDAPDEGRLMRWCSPEELGRLWKDAGLREVELGELVVSARYEDFDDYWAPFPSGLAPSGAYCASLPPDAQRELRDACFRRLGSPEGRFELTARAWLVTGRT